MADELQINELQIDRSRPVLLLAPRFLQAVEHPLVGEVAGLVWIKVGNPRLRTDPVSRFPHFVEEAIGFGLTDTRPQPSMMILFVYLDSATGCILEHLSRQSFENQSIRIRRLYFLDRLGEEVGLIVSTLHHGVGDLILAVLFFVPLNEGFVVRGIEGLEVSIRAVMTNGVLATHRLDLLFGSHWRTDRDVVRSNAEFLELLIKGHDLVAP